MEQPPVAAALPPYSGLEPTCPKCGWIGATLQFREARGSIALPWNTAYVVDGPRLERLARHCQACSFHWGEAPLGAQSGRSTVAVVAGSSNSVRAG